MQISNLALILISIGLQMSGMEWATPAGEVSRKPWVEQRQ